MIPCARCGTQSPDTFRFCPGCGSALGDAGAVAPTSAPAAVAGPPRAPAPREERRVVTILFSDLAGFTSRSEQLDPEDARALLVPYYAILEDEITAHGGVVERHIGDGIMALFGAPIAHEDDPERAIRAALRIIEQIPALGTELHARIGINTGEILYRSEGQGREDAVTGDAANTAARLQGRAPVDGVVVGEATWRATSRVFEYAEHPAATVKGKAEPIRVFQPTAARARLGAEGARTYDTPYVGRASEMTALVAAFHAALADHRPRMVMVVGEPGIGKSRLIAELGRYVDALPDLVAWRQGRCLPYGDGITFWALGEIVKAEAGILETDDPTLASTKIHAALADTPERDWLAQRLLPLVGVATVASAAREELFAAWTAFIGGLAAERPTIVLVEDLHWAEPALLDFLVHLVGSATSVPLLVVGTARPELFERVPTFAAGNDRVVRIDLHRLSDIEASELVGALVGSVVPDELRKPILDRAAGNPLYVEELVRLLRDRDLLVQRDGAASLRPGATLPLPESISALLAARLDTLPAGERATLGGAAVIGKVFWTGAVALLAERDRADIALELDVLAGRELVRPVVQSSMAGEDEFVFWHVLARDVAYGQLPRSTRAALHVSAANWLEARAGERATDIAELLAYHWSTALELARVAGQTDRAAALEPKALDWLLAAGRKALGLDTAAAVAAAERAILLTPAGHGRRPEVLLLFSEAIGNAGQASVAAAAADEALDAFRRSGDRRSHVRALSLVRRAYGKLGGRAQDLTNEALAILEDLPPGPELVSAMADAVADAAIDDEPERAIEYADRVMALAAGLGLARPVRALAFRGLARMRRLDPGGIDDVREAIELGTRTGEGREVGLAYYNLGVDIGSYGGLAAAISVLEEGLAFVRRRGIVEFEAALESLVATAMAEGTDVERGLALLDEIVLRSPDDDRFTWLQLVTNRANARADRGEAHLVVDDLEPIERVAREMEQDAGLVGALAALATVRLALGQADAALAYLRELAPVARFRDVPVYQDSIPDMVRDALRAGDPALASQLIDGVVPGTPADRESLRLATAALHEARGDLEAATDDFASTAPYWEAFGRLSRAGEAWFGLGRCLVALGRVDEALPALHAARAAFARRGARPRLAEVEALLQTITAGDEAAPA